MPSIRSRAAALAFLLCAALPGPALAACRIVTHVHCVTTVTTILGFEIDRETTCTENSSWVCDYP